MVRVKVGSSVGTDDEGIPLEGGGVLGIAVGTPVDDSKQLTEQLILLAKQTT